MKIFNVDIKIDSPETLIANKINYGSLQDFEDALSVLLRMEVDQEKLKSNCNELGVLKQLELLKRLAQDNLTISELEAILDEVDYSF